MTKAHSPYGMSQIERYVACPGSVALAMKAPPEKSSSYADEGTFAHRLAELCLEAGETDARDRLGTPVTIQTDSGPSTKLVDLDMVAAVNVYLDAVWTEYSLDEASEIAVEERVSLEVDAADDGEVFSTLDCLVYSPARRKVTIFDYKHGAGVIVHVENNKQVKGYGIMAVKAHPEWDVTEIELVVVQPRAFNAGEDLGVKRWPMPMVEIIEFPYELNEAIALSKSENPPIVAGEHCHWCPASTICTAREQEFARACGEEFVGLSLPSIADQGLPAPVDLDFEQMASIVAAYERLGPQVADIRQAMDDHLLGGGHIGGWKVVEKVARRKWDAVEEEVAMHLQLFYDIPEDLTRPRALVTITEAKRLLKSYVPKADYAAAEKDLTLKFTTKDSTGLTTAPESDKRAAIQPVAAEFGSVQLGSLMENTDADG